MIEPPYIVSLKDPFKRNTNLIIKAPIVPKCREACGKSGEEKQASALWRVH